MLSVCAGKHITKPLKVEPEPQLPLSVYPLELKCDAGDHCHLLKVLSVCYECQETENLSIYHECQETDIHKDEQIPFTYESWASEEVIWSRWQVNSTEEETLGGVFHPRTRGKMAKWGFC